MSRDRLRFVFAFLAVFGAVLFLVRPEPSIAQIVFRSAVAAAGLVGLVILGARRR